MVNNQPVMSKCPLMFNCLPVYMRRQSASRIRSGGDKIATTDLTVHILRSSNPTMSLVSRGFRHIGTSIWLPPRLVRNETRSPLEWLVEFVTKGLLKKASRLINQLYLSFSRTCPARKKLLPGTWVRIPLRAPKSALSLKRALRSLGLLLLSDHAFTVVDGLCPVHGPGPRARWVLKARCRARRWPPVRQFFGLGGAH